LANADRKRPEIILAGVMTDDLFSAWPFASKVLEPALDRGETLEDLLTKLYRKEAQLWMIYDNGEQVAAVVTEIFPDNNGQVCNIWAVGGTGINRWIGYLDTIEQWAKANGCSAVIIEKTRKGLQRLLRDYKVTHVTLGKDI